MIGTKVRGFHHFIRMVKALGEVQFLYRRDACFIGGGTALYVSKDTMRNPFMLTNSDFIILFNESNSNIRYNPSVLDGAKLFEKIDSLYKRYGSIFVVPVNENKYNEESVFYGDKIILPEDFDEKYSQFLKLNKKQVESACKYCDKNSALSKYFYAISSGSKNFFSWAINAFFKSKASMFFIERVLNWSNNYSQLSKKLKRGTITAYTNPHDFTGLSEEITALRREKRANDTINMFNTAQKKALKAMKLTDKDHDTLSKFGKLSYKKKINFIKKMSTIEDAKEIIKQMSFLADIHFDWNKQSLLDCINNSEFFNCDVVIDKDNIVLLKVNDYETVKRLAKTTNWCISKDKKYWDEYVESKSDAIQYVIFDFSRQEDDNLSIVGFTAVHDKGITNAHDFQNKNLMSGREHVHAEQIKSFVSKLVDCNNIYGILDRDGISLSDIIFYTPSHYKWTRDDMFNYLAECIDEYSYYIISDLEDKVAFIAENEDIKYFLGDSFLSNMRNSLSNDCHVIVFADFTKKETDPNKIVFGIINYDFASHESNCNTLYNERCEVVHKSFEAKLEEYKLPYDIICRTDNVVDRFFSAIVNYEISIAKELINNEKVNAELKGKERADIINSCLVATCFSFSSLDYINLFYDNGYTLSQIIGSRRAYIIVNDILNVYREQFGEFGSISIPTENEVRDFNNGKIKSKKDSIRIGYFIMLMKIIENEKDEDFAARVAIMIHSFGIACDLFDVIMTRIMDSIDINKNLEASKYIVSYAYNLDRIRVKNAINKKKIGGQIRKFIANYSKDYTSKTTEMWVKANDNIYTIEGMNEEAVAHSPRIRQTNIRP